MLDINEREKEILILLSFGLTRNQIAEQIYLSTNTVSTYIKALNKKLSVSNKAHAVMRGFQIGVLRTDQNFENYKYS